jgi:hypothetical protein
MYKAERSEGSLGLQSSDGFISAPRLWRPRNYQNQLCWISYQVDIRRVRKPILFIGAFKLLESDARRYSWIEHGDFEKDNNGI